jgi:hypothetical protein
VSQLKKPAEQGDSILHKLADDIIDRRNMVSVEGMPGAEHISQESGTEQYRPINESDQSPGPSRDIRRYQDGIDYRCFGFDL